MKLELETLQQIHGQLTYKHNVDKHMVSRPSVCIAYVNLKRMATSRTFHI